jgi:hypothetical protein
MVYVHNEITGGVLRIFRNGGRWPDPFDYSMFYIGDEGTATLKALVRASPQPCEFRAIAHVLLQNGFHTMRWTRHRANGAVMVKTFMTERMAV